MSAALLPAYAPAAPRVRAMTRCECAGVPFSEVAYRMEVEGLSLAAVKRATGCAGTCTACEPDLEEYLAVRGLRPRG